MSLPILYSLRNCPFAMRARLAIYKSAITIELRDVVLSNKPQQMLAASPKGEVPTLVLPSGEVIDESLEVMLWALNENDPDNLLQVKNFEHTKAQQAQTEMLALIHQFDNKFKAALEAYKCAKRYHETNIDECRQACELFIQPLEITLSQHTFIMGNSESLADIALLPFIRQFAKVERPWYVQSPYPNVKRWLNHYLQSAVFTKVMAKYPLWQEGNAITLFSSKK